MDNIKEIKLEELLPAVSDFLSGGYRIVQMCCTKLEENKYQLNYSFDKDYNMTTLRFVVAKDTEIQSISKFYFSAFLYENEMNELFGLKIKNIAVDFKGTLYKKAKDSPFDKVTVSVGAKNVE